MFRKSSDFFGLSSEKVWWFKKNEVTLLAKRMFMGKVAQEDVNVVNYDTFLCQYVGLKLEQ